MSAAYCVRNQYVKHIGEAKVVYNKFTAFPVSPVCTATERGKIVQYPARPSQCFLQGDDQHARIPPPPHTEVIFDPNPVLILR